MGRPSKYTEEFRRDAVDLVRSSGRPINQVARELGMSHETLRNWVRAEERRTTAGPAADGSGLSVADKDAEIARLRREVAELRQEKEILRKAAAYFAKEMDRPPRSTPGWLSPWSRAPLTGDRSTPRAGGIPVLRSTTGW